MILAYSHSSRGSQPAASNEYASPSEWGVVKTNGTSLCPSGDAKPKQYKKQPRQAVLYEWAWRGLIQKISSDLTTTYYHRRKNTNSRIIDTPQ